MCPCSDPLGSEVGATDSSAGHGQARQATLVTAPRCHLCDDAKSLLVELQTIFPLELREVDMTSDQGIELVRRFNMPFPPMLILDGERFGHGRISRRKLIKHLGGET